MSKPVEKIEALAKALYYSEGLRAKFEWESLNTAVQLEWINQARAAIRHLGCQDGVVPDVATMRAALRAAKEYLLDGGPCHHEADGAADGSDCEVCKLMAVIDAAIAGEAG